jgi:hypothetical protein
VSAETSKARNVVEPHVQCPALHKKLAIRKKHTSGGF